MTPEEIAAHLAERKRKIRHALERLEAREQSNEAKIAKLNKLLERLEALTEQTAQPTGRPGRPRTWKDALGYDTVLIVEAMQRQGLSITAALRSLRKGPPWNRFSEEVLSTRYHEARKFWEPLMKEFADIERAIAECPLDNSPIPDARRLVRGT